MHGVPARARRTLPECEGLDSLRSRDMKRGSGCFVLAEHRVPCIVVVAGRCAHHIAAHPIDGRQQLFTRVAEVRMRYALEGDRSIRRSDSSLHSAGSARLAPVDPLATIRLPGARHGS